MDGPLHFFQQMRSRFEFSAELVERSVDGQYFVVSYRRKLNGLGFKFTYDYDITPTTTISRLPQVTGFWFSLSAMTKIQNAN